MTEPPHREAQRLHRQLIAPVGVVHDHGQRSRGRQRAEHVEQRRSSGQRVQAARPHQVDDRLTGGRSHGTGELFQQAAGQQRFLGIPRG